MKTHRLARVAEVIREVAATTILFELRDPRVKNVTVTRAEVAADLQHAKVYVSVMGTDAEQRTALKGLQNAAGFIQSKLADRLLTRFLPVLVGDYLAGMSVKALAERYGIHRATVFSHLRRRNVPSRRPGLGIDEKAEAVRLARAGVSMRAIGRRMGVDRKAVRLASRLTRRVRPDRLRVLNRVKSDRDSHPVRTNADGLTSETKVMC